MKRLLILVVLATMPVLITLGQVNYSGGFIISNQGDTIYGLIRDQGEAANAGKCIFRTSPDVPLETFEPGSIRAYKTDEGRYYVSKEVTIKDETHRIFLEFLVDGIYNLYYANFLGAERYFIESAEGRIIELADEKQQFMQGGIMMTRDTYRYRGVLLTYFSDAPTIRPEIEKAELNHKSLIGLTRDYHELTCKDEECIVYSKAEVPPKFGFGIEVGAQYAALHDVDNEKVYHAVLGNNYLAGIELRMEFPRRNKNFAFNLAANYASLYLYEYNPSETTDSYTSTHVYVKQVKAKLGSSYLMFVSPDLPIRVGFNAGLQGNYYMDFRNIILSETMSSSGVLTHSRTENENQLFDPLQFGAYLSLVADYNFGRILVYLKCSYDYIIIINEKVRSYDLRGIGVSTGILF